MFRLFPELCFCLSGLLQRLSREKPQQITSLDRPQAKKESHMWQCPAVNHPPFSATRPSAPSVMVPFKWPGLHSRACWLGTLWDSMLQCKCSIRKSCTPLAACGNTRQPQCPRLIMWDSRAWCAEHLMKPCSVTEARGICTTTILISTAFSTLGFVFLS